MVKMFFGDSSSSFGRAMGDIARDNYPKTPEQFRARDSMMQALRAEQDMNAIFGGPIRVGPDNVTERHILNRWGRLSGPDAHPLYSMTAHALRGARSAYEETLQGGI